FLVYFCFFPIRSFCLGSVGFFSDRFLPLYRVLIEHWPWRQSQHTNNKDSYQEYVHAVRNFLDIIPDHKAYDRKQGKNILAQLFGILLSRIINVGMEVFKHD
uniref:Uncharacterized protein n=1 Tax=Ciona savignyi TaxID=51511 RepID=H2YGV7_CIOSA